MSNNKHTLTNLERIKQVIVDGEQPLYEMFHNERVGRILSDVTLEKSLYHGQPSKRSLRIKFVDKGQDLAIIFGLKSGLFGEKYLQAISGDGHEARRIRTLHSSSLISLLCFYGVSEERPLHLSFDNRDVLFTETSFEVKNPVGIDENGKNHESNMDVVLTGKDVKTHKPVILFLESKFSEYLSWGTYSGISNHVYGEIYSQLSRGKCLERMGLKYENDSDNKGYSTLSSITGRTRHYAGGIKQMISHYLGVGNAAESKEYKGYDIYLGEILYRFPDSIDHKGHRFRDYDHLYRVLAEGLNELSEGRFKTLGYCLTYQDVFKAFDLDDSVRAFYFL